MKCVRDSGTEKSETNCEANLFSHRWHRFHGGEDYRTEIINAISVFKLVRDNWNGSRSNEVVTQSPSWEDVQSAVVALDAGQHTLVVLEGSGNTEMLIGGGEGKYVISV